MRITLVRTPEIAGGCGVVPTATALAAAGHDVLLLTDLPDTPGRPAPSGPGSLQVRTLRVTGPDDLTAAWSDARTGPPDVVHAVGPVAAAAATGTGVPVVAFVPPGLPDAPDGPARLLVASEDQHDALLSRGVARSRLRTVPACVDTDVFTPDGPSLRRDPQPRLVAHGPLTRGHGAGAAVSALTRVPGAELLVAGGRRGDDDPDRRRLFAAASAAGVADRVRFLGPVGPDLLPRLLRSADVVVAAPETDVAATPVLQAMACGRPVVATAVGGLRDVVVDGVTGVHVRPGRVVELSAAVRSLLADDATRLGYGVAGRDRARSRFDRARIADALLTVYRELVGGPGTDDGSARAAPAGVAG